VVRASDEKQGRQSGDDDKPSGPNRPGRVATPNADIRSRAAIRRTFPVAAPCGRLGLPLMPMSGWPLAVDRAVAYTLGHSAQLGVTAWVERDGNMRDTGLSSHLGKD
jgi:hypothetical protein